MMADKINSEPKDVAQKLKYVDGDKMEVEIKMEHVKDLGIQLKLDNQVVIRAYEQSKEDLSTLKFATQIIKLWFECERNPTWSTLVEALKMAHEQVIAEEIALEIAERGRNGSVASAFNSPLPSSSSVGPSFSLSTSLNSSELVRSGRTEQTVSRRYRNLSSTGQSSCVEEEMLEDNEEEIKDHFRSLYKEVCTELKSHGSTPSEIRSYVLSLCDDDPTFDQKTKHCRRLSRLFDIIGQLGLWQFDHYSLLKRLIGEIKDKDSKQDMKEKMDAYISTDLRGYLVTQKLVNMLPYPRDRNLPEEPNVVEFDEKSIVKLRTELGIETRYRITNETLRSYVHVYWDRMRKRFDIPSLTAFILSIVRGSVTIRWLIPPSWACCILSELLTAVDFFNENDISWVEINAIRVYDDKNGVVGNEVLCSTWLQQASASGRMEKVISVLDQGVGLDISLPPKEGTVLTVAAEYGHNSLVEFFLERGADLYSIEKHTGRTALFLAAEEGYLEIVKTLLLHDDSLDLISRKDKEEYSPLMIAAKRGHHETMQTLLKHSPGQETSSALLLAAKYGHIEAIKVLDKFGAAADNMSEDGKTPLSLAAERGHSSVVEHFMNLDNENLDLNSQDQDGKSPLMLAAEAGHSDIVKKFLHDDNRHLDIDAQDLAGKTALYLACEKGRKEVVKLLLTNTKYSPDVLTRDNDGKTALDIAKTNKYLEIASFLEKTLPLHKRAFETLKKPFEWLKNISINSKLVSVCKKGSLEEAMECLEKNADPNYRDTFDPFRWTSLMWASHRGHSKVVKLLLEKGADPNIQDGKGWSALILAARNAHYEAVQALVDHGAEVNMQTKAGWTALMWTSQSRGKKNTTAEALRNRRETAKILIAHGADPNRPTKDGWTPILQASQDGHAELVKILSQSGKADLEFVNEKKWSSLMIACKCNKSDVVKVLVEEGANVAYQKPDKMTALHIASSKGHADCISAITTSIPEGQKVVIDIKDKWGMTPLILASKQGHKEAAKVLLAAGANVDESSEEYAGWSALFFAMVGGYTDIVNILISNKASMKKDKNEQTPLSVALSVGRKDIYKKCIGFLREKPQVLKAITSSPEAVLEPAKETPLTSGGRDDEDKPTVATPPVIDPPGLSETEIKIQIQQLEDEAAKLSKGRGTMRDVFKKLNQRWTIEHTEAMDFEGKVAAGAA